MNKEEFKLNILRQTVENKECVLPLFVSRHPRLKEKGNNYSIQQRFFSLEYELQIDFERAELSLDSPIAVKFMDTSLIKEIWSEPGQIPYYDLTHRVNSSRLFYEEKIVFRNNEVRFSVNPFYITVDNGIFSRKDAISSIDCVFSFEIKRFTKGKNIKTILKSLRYMYELRDCNVFVNALLTESLTDDFEQEISALSIGAEDKKEIFQSMQSWDFNTPSSYQLIQKIIKMYPQKP